MNIFLSIVREMADTSFNRVDKLYNFYMYIIWPLILWSTMFGTILGNFQKITSKIEKPSILSMIIGTTFICMIITLLNINSFQKNIILFIYLTLVTVSCISSGMLQSIMYSISNCDKNGSLQSYTIGVNVCGILIPGCSMIIIWLFGKYTFLSLATNTAAAMATSDTLSTALIITTPTSSLLDTSATIKSLIALFSIGIAICLAVCLMDFVCANINNDGYGNLLQQIMPDHHQNDVHETSRFYLTACHNNNYKDTEMNDFVDANKTIRHVTTYHNNNLSGKHEKKNYHNASRKGFYNLLLPLNTTLSTHTATTALTTNLASSRLPTSPSPPTPPPPPPPSPQPSTSSSSVRKMTSTIQQQQQQQQQSSLAPIKSPTIPWYPKPFSFQWIIHLCANNKNLILSLLFTSISTSITINQVVSAPIKFTNDWLNKNSTVVSLFFLNMSIIFGTILPIEKLVQTLKDLHILFACIVRFCLIIGTFFTFNNVWWILMGIIIVSGISNGNLFNLIYSIPVHRWAKVEILGISRIFSVSLLFGFLIGSFLPTFN